MKPESIPRKVVFRLSLYCRNLGRLADNGVETVSSHALAAGSGVKPPQLRKDLAHFGRFGTRGKGYPVQRLRAELQRALETTRLQPVVLIGVGNLGSALLNYPGFAREGFEIVGAFDRGARRVRKHAGIQVRPMRDLPRFLRSHNVKVAIVAVPGPEAQEVVNRLVAGGIRAILNFAPVSPQVPDEVVTNNVDLASELETLGCFIR